MREEFLFLWGRPVVLVIRVPDPRVLKVIRPIVRDPVDVAKPLIPGFRVVIRPGAQGFEFVLDRLVLILLPPSSLFLARGTEPLREILRVPSLQPRRPRILGIVGDYLIGLV